MELLQVVGWLHGPSHATAAVGMENHLQQPVGRREVEAERVIVHRLELGRLIPAHQPHRVVGVQLLVLHDVLEEEPDILGGDPFPVRPLQAAPQRERPGGAVVADRPVLVHPGTHLHAYQVGMVGGGTGQHLHQIGVGGVADDRVPGGRQAGGPQRATVAADLLPRLHHQRVVGQPLLDRRQAAFRHPRGQHRRFTERGDGDLAAVQVVRVEAGDRITGALHLHGRLGRRGGLPALVRSARECRRRGGKAQNRHQQTGDNTKTSQNSAPHRSVPAARQP